MCFLSTSERGKTHEAVLLAQVHDIQLVFGFMNCIVFEGTARHVALTTDAGIDAPCVNLPNECLASGLNTPGHAE